MSLQLEKKNRIDGLSGIRIFLIMFIAAGHFIKLYITDLPEWLQGVFLNYYFFTSIFFMLSGFILTYVYFDAEKGIRISTKKFLFLRFIKIYPVHLLFILLMASRFFAVDEVKVDDYNLSYPKLYLAGTFLSQVFLLDAWNPFSLSVNGPAWSVSALFFFYFIFPIFCRYCKDFTIKQLYRTAYVLWALYLIYPTAYVILDLGSREAFYTGLLHHHPILRLPEFLIGVVACRIFELQRESRVSKPLYTDLNPSVVVMLAALLYAILPLFIPYALLHNGLFLPIQIMLVLSLAASQDKLTHFLSHPFLLKVSNASLTIFIAHYFILGWWGRVDQAFWFVITRKWEDWADLKQLVAALLQLKNQPTSVSFLSFLVGLAALIGISYLIQEYVVNPLSKWMRHLSIASSPQIKQRQTA
jgi:peptidoglycan/LPS O-acetylase OafA/YrhL